MFLAQWLKDEFQQLFELSEDSDVAIGEKGLNMWEQEWAQY